MDWAELITLDLSRFDEPNGKEELAKQLTYAAQHVGVSTNMQEIIPSKVGATDKFCIVFLCKEFRHLARRSR